VAARLGFLYIDTGSLYRAAALLADRAGISPENSVGIAALIQRSDIRLAEEGGARRVLLNGEDISAEVRTERVAHLASAFSSLPEVREALLGLQRRLGDEGGVVMDGRDIGTVVFPDAEVKIFLRASDEERSRRRWRELLDRGVETSLEEVHEDLLRRDRRDSTRVHAPLREASDAVVIDSTDLDPRQIVERIVEIAGRLRPR